MVLHKTASRNHRCKADYTAELPFPKASQPEDRIRDKPSWHTELDAVHTEPIPSILPQGLAQVLSGMQDISSSLKPCWFISTGMQSRCLPKLYCSTGMVSWPCASLCFHQSASWSQGNFCQAYLWDTSVFCIQGVCEKNDQLPLLPCSPMLGFSVFSAGP